MKRLIAFAATVPVLFYLTLSNSYSTEKYYVNNDTREITYEMSKKQLEQTILTQKPLTGFVLSQQFGYIGSNYSNNFGLGINLGFQAKVDNNFALGATAGVTGARRIGGISGSTNYGNVIGVFPMMFYGEYVNQNGFNAHLGAGMTYGITRGTGGNNLRSWMPTAEIGIGYQQRNRYNIELVYSHAFKNTHELYLNSVMLRITTYFTG